MELLISKMLENSKKEANSSITHELVIRHFVMGKLNSKNATKTRELFNQVKDEWPKYTVYNAKTMSFKIHEQEFTNLLIKNKVKSMGVEIAQELNSETNRIKEDNGENKEEQVSLKSSLSSLDFPKESPSLTLKEFDDDTGLCIKLLRDAMILQAKYESSIFENMPNIDITSLIITPTEQSWFGRFKRFVKLDLLSQVFLSKNKLGFGMKYEVRGGKITFFGIPFEDFDEKSIVVQLNNRSGKILKEIKITGQEPQGE